MALTRMIYDSVTGGLRQAAPGDVISEADVPVTEKFVALANQTIFVLNSAPAHAEQVKVYRNGLRVERVVANPAGKDQFVVGGANVTFGAGLSVGEAVVIDY